MVINEQGRRFFPTRARGKRASEALRRAALPFGAFLRGSARKVWEIRCSSIFLAPESFCSFWEFSSFALQYRARKGKRTSILRTSTLLLQTSYHNHRRAGTPLKFIHDVSSRNV